MEKIKSLEVNNEKNLEAENIRDTCLNLKRLSLSVMPLS